jgi:hypothetical protein
MGNTNSNRKCMVDVGERTHKDHSSNDMHICNYYNILIFRYDFDIIKSNNNSTIAELHNHIDTIKHKKKYIQCNCDLVNINSGNSLQFNKKICLILIFNLLIMTL